jgi:hypothetical protein
MPSYDTFDWNQAGEGAVGGGMTGAAIGTAVYPGLGTAIGGAAGFLGGGLLGGLMGGQDQLKNSLGNLADYYGSRQAPTGGAVQAGDSQFRQNQAGLISQLEAMARGEGPSAASLQMRQAMDRAAAGQASAAAGAGGRGVNAGAALRNASNQTAALQAQNARDTGMMRVQEQLGAISQLGSAIQGARGQDQSLAQFNAGQVNQMTQADMQAILQQYSINQQGQLQAYQQLAKAMGPGLGTELMAGGGKMMPGMAQMLQGGGGGGGAAAAA